jgi:DNA-binding transcriptional MerR regulator
MVIDSFTGVDRLAVMQRLQSEGYGPRQIDVLLAAEMRAEHERLRFERELKAAERRAYDAEVRERAERAQREQVENKLHNLTARRVGGQ